MHYITRDYSARSLALGRWIIAFFMIVFGIQSFVYWTLLPFIPVIAGYTFIAVGVYLSSIQFEVDGDDFIILRKYGRRTWHFAEIDEIRIREHGIGPRSSPGLVIYFKNGKRIRYAFYPMDKDDLDQFCQVLISRLGEDKFYINRQEW